MACTDASGTRGASSTRDVSNTCAAADAEGAPCLIITADDLHLFAEGCWQRSWEKMGAHPDVQDGREGWLFRVWAPGVRGVHVVGDFNDWDPLASPLAPLDCTPDPLAGTAAAAATEACTSSLASKDASSGPATAGEGGIATAPNPAATPTPVAATAAASAPAAASASTVASTPAAANTTASASAAASTSAPPSTTAAASTPAPAPASGIWQGFVPGARRGQRYKYVIETAAGDMLWKADPYAFESECPPETASRLWTLDGYEWHDAAWLARRAAARPLHEPLNIYEVHLGSWRRHGTDPRGAPREDGTYPGPGDPFPAQRGDYYTYDDLARELPAYARRMGYTHVELLPVMEHPFDGSWGYQPTGYFAATARFGTPQQFMHLVDACHEQGIGVILDWVAGGFCADAHGLANFNGQMLYEREVHPNWGTHKFDFGRGQVRSFLTSNALFWLEVFHLDGIRMDGVTSMLYLNFGKADDAPKAKNARGGEEDLDAVSFIRQLNTAVAQRFPDALMIAEESTAWPQVTAPAAQGGLGFTLKWDMGWMNDTLRYLKTDFPWRPGAHNLLTFSMMYAFDERFVLPLSHDEVVHGKSSLIERMPGDWWRQFAGLRLLAFYQMTHPGAKLNFMGNEIGQFIEWRYYESIEWFMAEKHQTHERQQTFVAALNRLYLDEPALWERSFEPEGFEWIDPDDARESTISFVRRGARAQDDLIVLINFDPATHERFRLGAPAAGTWRVAFTTDEERFGGTSYRLAPAYPTRPVAVNGRAQSIELPLPSLSGIVLKRDPEPHNPHEQEGTAHA